MLSRVAVVMDRGQVVRRIVREVVIEMMDVSQPTTTTHHLDHAITDDARPWAVPVRLAKDPVVLTEAPSRWYSRTAQAALPHSIL